MAGYVAKTAANMLLKKQMKEYEKKNSGDKYDPLFARIEDPKRPGKLKKVKKVIPSYIPEHDAMILASVRTRAYRLDWGLFDLFGTRFGWESVIGIIPGFGDVIGVLFALSIYRKCQKVDGGLPSSLSMQMLMLIFADFLVGLIPFIGDLGDAFFKCNSRNVYMLERHLDAKYKPSAARRDDRDHAATSRTQRRQNRKSGIYDLQDPPPATVFEDWSDEEDERRQFMQQTDPRAGAAPVRTGQPATAPATQANAVPAGQKKSSKWFSSR